MRCFNRKRREKHWTKANYRKSSIVWGKKLILQKSVYMKSNKNYVNPGIIKYVKSKKSFKAREKLVPFKVYFVIDGKRYEAKGITKFRI